MTKSAMISMRVIEWRRAEGETMTGNGVQLGVFYGRADPNTAGHTGFLTMDDARQMAVDFAKLPKLLNGRAVE
jgi:hypothetical protein